MKNHTIVSLLAFLLLTGICFCETTAIAPQEDDEPNLADKIIATVLGKKVLRGDIDPSSELIEDSTLPQKEFTQWLKQYQGSKLRELIFKPLLEKYAAENNIDANTAEIEEFSKAMNQRMAQQAAKHRQTRNKLVQEFKKPDVNEMRKMEIESQIATLDTTIKQMEKGFAASSNRPAKTIIKAWKVNKSLFKKYGGRVIFQQAGPEPLDAYLKFLKQQKATGQFEIKDKDAAALFWNYFTNDKMHTFYKDPNEAVKFMNTPWWRTEPSEDNTHALSEEKPEIPDDVKARLLEFQQALKQPDWTKALAYCSDNVRAKATEYDSAEHFFKDYVPVKGVISLSRFRRHGESSRGNEVISYFFPIDIEDPNREYPLEWNLSVIRTDPNWIIDFTAKPLRIWTKHELLKFKSANGKLVADSAKTKNGLDNRLIPLSQSFAIGQPMLFRIELKNITSETLEYTQTSYMVNDPMIVKDANGNVISYADTQYQTAGGSEFLEPGEIAVLADNYDIRSQYHIIKPGRYSFHFRGFWVTEKPSNVVEVDVKHGQLSPLESVVEALMPVIPEGWKLTRRVVSDEPVEANHSADFILVSLIGKQGQKATTDHGIGLSLFINPTKSCIESIWFKGELVGQNEWGTIYVQSNNAEQLWPDYKKQIMIALGVQGH